MTKNHQAPLVSTPHRRYNQLNFTTNQGSWPSILEQLGINASYLKNKHGPCPICGGKDRFRFDNKGSSGSFYCNNCGAGSGIKLLMLYHNWNYQEACNRLIQILGIEVKNHGFSTNIPIEINSLRTIDSEQKTNNWRLKSLISTWQQSNSVTINDPVDVYLKSRGINLNEFPLVLRHHSKLPYYSDNKKLIGYFNAMLSLVTSQNNQVVTLHRTYIENGRKADIPEPKKLMPAIKPGASLGASIKLYEPIEDKIGLAEGIENALSFYIATGVPAWSTINANGLEKIILPPSIREITIAVDNDVSNRGQEAASRLTERLLAEGRRVKRVIPPKVGQDFNDLLLEDKL